MTDEQQHPQQEPSAFEVGVVARLRRELADAKAAATALAQRDATTIAGLREAATAHCTWLDVLNARIAELTDAKAQLADYEAARDAGASEIAMWVAEVELQRRQLIDAYEQQDAWRDSLAAGAVECDTLRSERNHFRAERDSLRRACDTWREQAYRWHAAAGAPPADLAIVSPEANSTTPGPALVAETAANIAAERMDYDGAALKAIAKERVQGDIDSMCAAMPAHALRPGDGIPR